MDKENALDLIWEARDLEYYELTEYIQEHSDIIDSIDNEEELLDDFDDWKEQQDLLLEKVLDRIYWSSL